MERRTPDPPLSTSFRSSSSSSSLFSSFKADSFDFSGFPPQSEVEEVPSLRWLPDGLQPGTAHSNTGGESWSGNSTGESIPTTPRNEGEILSSSNLKVFTFKELKGATRNFGPDCILGGGGFSCVYKGWIDEHTLSTTRPRTGMEVAIKKQPKSMEGHKEWLTKVQYLGQLHHTNLVKLIGYCLEGNYRLLVYEFMPRGSLENHLFRRGGGQPLSWTTRIKVAVGAARGLSFLHDLESQVIHRHVKTSNILLDAEFNAKLLDFGFAKTWADASFLDVRDGLAKPEYISKPNVVYNFGVVLLELLSGQRVLDNIKVGMKDNLVHWAMPLFGVRRKLFQIMDTRLEGQFPKEGAFTVAKLALLCLHNECRMFEVLATLEQLQDSSKAMTKLAQMK